MGKHDYDYIIAGAGAAGLSLLIHLIDSGRFSDKKILLVDKDRKKENDRTWCFWETQAGLFEEVVFRKWSRLWFHDVSGPVSHNIDPYQYKLIRGKDFYNYCFHVIAAQPNITVAYGNVSACKSDKSGTYVVLDGKKITAQYIFNSILFEKPVLTSRQHYLLQHFRGWVIETDNAAFDPLAATLMDFRVEQVNGDTTFVYVMPFSENIALVEYTLFSKELLKADEYDAALDRYCKDYLSLSQYTIMEKEMGAIPMTDYKFQASVDNIINVGTAGGQTKASSGYTFHFIQEHSRAIVSALSTTGKPFVPASFMKKRFDLYDHTLLNILSARQLPGRDIFSILMRNNAMPDVFKFLDNETSLLEELKIIRKLPTRIFLRAALS